MIELFTNYGLDLIFGLISAGALAYARYISTKFQRYKDLEKEDQDDKIDERIDAKLKPIFEKLDIDLQRFDSIKEYFRYLIIEECEHLLEKGSMTSEEYQDLSEMFKVYHGIGGNSQAEDYYHRTSKLPIVAEKEKKGED